MNKELIKNEALIIILMLLPNIYFLSIYNQLPEQVPIHWNIQGEADNYGPKWVLPLIHLGVYALLLIAPIIDPRKKNYQVFSKAYYRLRLALILFFGAFNVLVFMSQLGHDIDISRILVIGIFLLFIVLGNYMNNLKPNWFIGIRTPWTMENEEVWRKTHYLASRLFFGFGLIALILSFFLAEKTLLPMLLIVTILAALIPVVYSYKIYKELK